MEFLRKVQLEGIGEDERGVGIWLSHYLLFWQKIFRANERNL